MLRENENLTIDKLRDYHFGDNVILVTIYMEKQSNSKIHDWKSLVKSKSVGEKRNNTSLPGIEPGIF